MTQFISYIKMESFKVVRYVVTNGCWTASVELKSAFYSIRVHPEHRRYLLFFWKQPYFYIVMPNGYTDAPRIFTKATKLGFSSLRAQGYLSVLFLDDRYLQGETYHLCQENIRAIIQILQNLGFTVHPVKSSFLGFVVDSVNMTVTIPEHKQKRLFIFEF